MINSTFHLREIQIFGDESPKTFIFYPSFRLLQLFQDFTLSIGFSLTFWSFFDAYGVIKPNQR